MNMEKKGLILLCYMVNMMVDMIAKQHRGDRRDFHLHHSVAFGRQAERHSTVSSLPARIAPARGSLRTMTCAIKELHLGGLEL